VSTTLGYIAEYLGCELKGESECQINSVATLASAGEGQISFLANAHYRRFLGQTKASAVILKEDDAEHCPTNILLTNNPYLAYAQVATLLNPPVSQPQGIHSSAVIEEGCDIAPSVSVAANSFIAAGVKLGAGVVIGPNCILESGISVGAGSRLIANVTLCHGVKIGDGCLFHPGVVIGADGFGIANNQGQWFKVPQLGSVTIADNVEIGANTTVDRGALEDTVIEEGVKLDNQIQVAHNVHIGAHTAIAGCTAIAGSATIGKHCQIGGQVSIVGHLSIADGVIITAASLVSSAISEPGIYSSGMVVEPNKKWNKNVARFRQLDDIARRLKMLEKGREK
jgi:UDP-3-O-[3-hydroxymyristoyl] glucosamine N-acyltransferase